MEGDADDEVAWDTLPYNSDRRASTQLSLVIHSAPYEQTSVMRTIPLTNY